MRTPLLATLGLSFALATCGGTDNNNKTPTSKPECSDGIDNDGDGLIDFPDDPGCVGENDVDESSLPAPQCSDGRDNDNDGKIDFPQDPGCIDAHQDTETDDCPDGPNCPQCSNGQDDDGNGQTDYPSDTGCISAADTDESANDPFICGDTVTLQELPFDGHKISTLGPGGPSNLHSLVCGGSGKEDVYEIRLTGPKVIKATTNLPGTSPTTDTVLYLMDIGCQTELACNDETTETTPTPIEGSSQLTVSAPVAGTYYLVVDNNSGLGGAYELQVNILAGLGEACDPAVVSCGDGLVCRIPLNQTANVCSNPVCNDGVDDDGDGKLDFPDDPGCDSPTDGDEADTCPAGPGCPQCGDGLDNDSDGHTDYPDDPQCTSASTGSESCNDADPSIAITMPTQTGNTTSLHDDYTSESCQASAMRPDQPFSIVLPVPVASITFDTIGTTWDTILSFRGSSCAAATELAGGCNDDGSSVQSVVTMTNVPAGAYSLILDGYSGSTGLGAYTLNTHGTVANGTACTSTLFTNGVLTCTAPATCTAGTCQ